MKVVLVNPPIGKPRFKNPPVGLLYLASALAGHDVSVVDGCVVGEDGILRETQGADVVGVQILSMYRHSALRIAALVKAQDPRVRVVLGGPHASAIADHVRSYPFVDGVCVGDGERWIVDYVEGRTPVRDLSCNLDDIPLPAWHLVNFNAYKTKEISICTSRGCTGHCSFCFNPNVWKEWRGRSAAGVVAELAMLIEHGKDFYFTDDHFTADRQRVLDICEGIVYSGLKIKWACSARVDCIDAEMLGWMKLAGCWQISFGVESISPSIVHSMHKDIGLKETEEAIQMTKEAGITVTAAMMIGSPGETDKTIQENALFLKRVKPDHVAYAKGVWILPGTALYRQAVREGHISDEFWFTHTPIMYWPFSKEQLDKWSLMLAKPKHIFRYPKDWLLTYFPKVHEFLFGSLPVNAKVVR